MSYSLVYFDEVTFDMREAKSWYKKQQDGLDKRFAESIKVAIQTLQKNPLVYAIRYKNIRIAHPKSFPYGIHFYIDSVNTQIVIVALIHGKEILTLSLKDCNV